MTTEPADYSGLRPYKAAPEAAIRWNREHGSPATAKNRSYTIREEMADEIGAPHHNDWTASRYGHDIEVILPHPQAGMNDPIHAFLRSTTNAGFRGIEGSFEGASEGWHGRHFTRSLGDIAEWTTSPIR